MRLWLFASNFNNWAGPNTHLLDLGNYLKGEMGVDVTLVTHDAPAEGDFAERLRYPTLRILGGGTPTPWSRIRHSRANAARIRRLASENGVEPREVFVNSSIDTLYSAHAALGAKLATGYNVLSNNPASPLFRGMDRVAARTMVGKILAHTRRHRQTYIDIGVDPAAITVLPHCVDVKRIMEMSGPDGAEQPGGQSILFAGSLTAVKGVDVLLEAHEKLSRTRRTKLVIMGDGPLKDAVLRAEGTRGGVRYLGWQPPRVLLAQMGRASVVAVPSRDEAFGMVALEAMTLERPVVASRVGGLPEIVTDGLDGLLVEPGDVDGLAEALSRILDDEKLGRRLGAGGRATVEGRYSVERIAPRFIEFMEARND